MFLRYSSSVVAPITCSSPRASAGLSMLRGVHRALRSPGADDRVHLVDEEDQLVGGAADLVDHRLQPLLELAAVLRAGDHPGEVERDHAAAGQRLRHLVVDDALRDALDDRGLADAGLAEQGRVVLRPPREDLDRLLDLVGAADHRVELALARLLGEVAAELLQPRRARLLTRSARVHAADDRAAQLRVRDAEPLQQLPRRRLFVTREGEQHVLGADVGGTELARLLVGGQQRGLRVRGQRRGDVGPLRLLGLLLELRRDRGGVRADLLEDVANDVVLEGAVEQVVALEVEAPPLQSRLGGPLEERPGRVAEELGHVHALGAPRRRLGRALRRRPPASGRRSPRRTRRRGCGHRRAGLTSAPPRGRSRRGTRPPESRRAASELAMRPPGARDVGTDAVPPFQASLSVGVFSYPPSPQRK